MKKIKLYCHYAFKGIDISTNGQLKPCCIFPSDHGPKIYLKEGIEKYKNSEWLKNFQQGFIDGKKHPGCQQCWDMEKNKQATMKKY